MLSIRSAPLMLAFLLLSREAQCQKVDCIALGVNKQAGRVDCTALEHQCWGSYLPQHCTSPPSCSLCTKWANNKVVTVSGMHLCKRGYIFAGTGRHCSAVARGSGKTESPVDLDCSFCERKTVCDCKHIIVRAENSLPQ